MDQNIFIHLHGRQLLLYIPYTCTCTPVHVHLYMYIGTGGFCSESSEICRTIQTLWRADPRILLHFFIHIHQTCMKLTRKSTEFCQFFPPAESAGLPYMYMIVHVQSCTCRCPALEGGKGGQAACLLRLSALTYDRKDMARCGSGTQLSTGF